MRRPVWLIGLFIVLFLAGCNAAPTPATAPTSVATATTADGTLQFRANGEDFVRSGFTSKDGWAISFEHVYVTLSEVTAYQSNPPYDAEAGGTIQAAVLTRLDTPFTVDLAAGDETAEPILFAETTTSSGRYNALSWKMTPAASGPAAGTTLMLMGTASKDGTTLPFNISIDRQLQFVCGDFVGDQRKGILEPGSSAELEATFHFDHLFGDAETPADDSLNTGALGFEPLAALAQNGSVTLDLAGLQAGLSAEDFALFEAILPSLGHVGEGHCHTPDA